MPFGDTFLCSICRRPVTLNDYVLDELGQLTHKMCFEEECGAVKIGGKDAAATKGGVGGKLNHHVDGIISLALRTDNVSS